MSDKTIGAIRTGLPAAWATLLVWAAARFGLDLSDEDMAALLVVIPVVIPIFYRAAREVEARWPTIGRVLFGSAKTPTYGEPSV